MAFLDNSGDIILDAVLTDTGRLRLAQGNGSFKITQFAFGDDEINYGLYNKNHPSGSAYYDLDILQTPVFEAFTNNASSMKYQLISNVNTQLLYLPVIRLNTRTGAGTAFFNGGTISNTYVVANPSDYSSLRVFSGVLEGTPTAGSTAQIVVDQGLDSSETDATKLLSSFDPTLSETSFIIELNNNFLTLVDKAAVDIPLSYVDDDGMASYSLSYREGVASIVNTMVAATNYDGTGGDVTPLVGCRDKRLIFKLKLKSDLNVNNSLYERFGGVTSISTTNYYYIDTFVTIKGVTIGTQITIPIKILKLKPT
jgi:hypothetical protein